MLTFRRRPRPAAHDVLLRTAYGSRCVRVNGDLVAARAEARRQRRADPLILGHRILAV